MAGRAQAEVCIADRGQTLEGSASLSGSDSKSQGFGVPLSVMSYCDEWPERSETDKHLLSF